MKSVPLILIATLGNHRSKLFYCLKSVDVDVLAVETCWQVRDLLAAHPVDLVITEVSLPDGNWCNIIRHLTDQGIPTGVVVTTETPTDSLWAEVFWRGAHDLLVEPYQVDEVRHVVRSALRAASTPEYANRKEVARRSVVHATMDGKHTNGRDTLIARTACR